MRKLKTPKTKNKETKKDHKLENVILPIKKLFYNFLDEQSLSNMKAVNKTFSMIEYDLEEINILLYNNITDNNVKYPYEVNYHTLNILQSTKEQLIKKGISIYYPIFKSGKPIQLLNEAKEIISFNRSSPIDLQIKDIIPICNTQMYIVKYCQCNCVEIICKILIYKTVFRDEYGNIEDEDYWWKGYQRNVQKNKIAYLCRILDTSDPLSLLGSINNNLKVIIDFSQEEFWKMYYNLPTSNCRNINNFEHQRYCFNFFPLLR